MSLAYVKGNADMLEHSHKPSLVGRIFRALLRNRLSRPIVQMMGGSMLKYMPGQITCREFEQFLFDYVEGKLAPVQRKRFDRHMAVCPFCRTSLAAYIKAINMGQKVCAEDEQDDVFDRAPQELINAILGVTINKE